ncbi:hypothetical protein MPTK1_5g21530 [Marchantia polymorpha subsp. ruderalis]|uniref:Uncharacterized protein n=1 Tax=Marchantia polymorpha subsp. ruderalis TaxID=1480154 RepID=A0AAF6BKS6_MARPO|nr:hypothetical protein Mp_5g21530 [Marchantia polymorpha subsp. ruderalis]
MDRSREENRTLDYACTKSQPTLSPSPKDSYCTQETMLLPTATSPSKSLIFCTFHLFTLPCSSRPRIQKRWKSITPYEKKIGPESQERKSRCPSRTPVHPSACKNPSPALSRTLLHFPPLRRWPSPWKDFCESLTGSPLIPCKIVWTYAAETVFGHHIQSDCLEVLRSIPHQIFLLLHRFEFSLL